MSSTPSSAAAAAGTRTAGGEETPLMYWCHECDMSIHLLFSRSTINIGRNENDINGTTSTTATTPTCPYCHLEFLELMDTTPSSCSAASLDFLHLDSPTFRSAFFPEIPTSEDDAHDEGDPDDRSFFSYFRLLPTVKIGDEDANEEEEEGSFPCAVCREQFGVEEEAKRLPCGHLFHGECILPWLSSGHLSCPLCRFQLLSDPPRVHEDDKDDDEAKWFLLLQSCMASSSSSNYAGIRDADASTGLPNADSK